MLSLQPRVRARRVALVEPLGVGGLLGRVVGALGVADQVQRLVCASTARTARAWGKERRLGRGGSGERRVIFLSSSAQRARTADAAEALAVGERHQMQGHAGGSGGRQGQGGQSAK
eukprot:1945398-Prymnesium_polylepis.1